MARLLMLIGIAGAFSLGGLHDSPPAQLFVAGKPVRVGHGSGEVVLLDLNGDRHLDLITKHLLTRLIQVRLGDGLGGFRAGPGHAIRLHHGPGAMAVADLNDDRRPDLVIARRDRGREYIDVYDGDGRGGFLAARQSFATSDAQAFYKPSVRVVDVNHDRAPDILTSNGRRDSIELLMNRLEGGFGPTRVQLPGPQNIHSFEPGDIDEDGDIDLVVVSRSADEATRLFLLRGTGDGAFDTPSLGQEVLRGGHISALADVNGDRHLDVVLTHARSNLLSVLLNSGKGEFSPAAGSPYGLPGEGSAAAVADVNGDRAPDLIVTTVSTEAEAFAGRVAVLVGHANTFVAGSGSPFEGGPGAYRIAVGDINEDGTVDIATSSFGGVAVGILLGRPL